MQAKKELLKGLHGGTHQPSPLDSLEDNHVISEGPSVDGRVREECPCSHNYSIFRSLFVTRLPLPGLLDGLSSHNPPSHRPAGKTATLPSRLDEEEPGRSEVRKQIIKTTIDIFPYVNKPK